MARFNRSLKSAQSTESILIVAPSWIGDMVMAQSLIIKLRQRYPHALIDVMAPTGLMPLLGFMSQINDSIGVNLQHGRLQLAYRFNIAKKLRKRLYQYAYILPNSYKSALIPWLAAIPQRIGRRGEARFGIINKIIESKNNSPLPTVKQYVGLIDPALICPQPLLKVTAAQQENILEQFHLKNSNNILALAIGAEYGSSKRWPVHHFTELTHHWIDKGNIVWLFGTKDDKGNADIIHKTLNPTQRQQCVNLCAKTRLDQAIILLSCVNTVVSNDSGLMHIAAALNKKVIGIFGATSNKDTPPLHPEAISLSLNLPCSPCNARICPLGHHNCLELLHPSQVIKHLTPSQ